MKKLLRKIFGVRKDETFNDAIFRYKINFSKLFYKKKYDNNDLKKVFSELKIKENDNIMVHSSWRSFYNYVGTPNDMINLMLSIIGTGGTLVMPCYGNNKKIFDVDNDKSAAGVLSEVLRKYKNSIRSRGAHFSCVACGKYAELICNEHHLSKYGFDSHSPYYKFVKLANSKIVMMGLGKKSVKLSLYHLVEMINFNQSFYKNLFEKKYSCVVRYKDNNNIIEKKYNNLFERNHTVPNKKNIRKIYMQSFCIHKRISNIDFCVIDAKKALDYIIEESNNNNYMIKVK